MRLSHDHFGGFKDAIDLVNTVETEMADNDYSVGMVVESIAKSRFAGLNPGLRYRGRRPERRRPCGRARRSVALVVGADGEARGRWSPPAILPFNMLRTIEAVLGLAPLGLNDALAAPMADLFDPSVSGWSYEARASDVLAATQLPIPKERLIARPAVGDARPLHDAAYWTAAMQGQDFHVEDRLDTNAFKQRALARARLRTRTHVTLQPRPADPPYGDSGLSWGMTGRP